MAGTLAQQLALSWSETLVVTSIPLLLLSLLVLIGDNNAKADGDYGVGTVLSQSLACFCN